MYDELVKSMRQCAEASCAGCKNDLVEIGCRGKLQREAADTIEEMQKCIDDLERKAITLQYEMMAEAESHIAEVNQLNKQIEVLSKMENTTHWIPVTERLPECDLGAEVGNIEWISCGMVHSGCFGRGGKYRDAYFRTWTDAGEGMDAKDADYWRAVTLPESPKEES